MNYLMGQGVLSLLQKRVSRKLKVSLTSATSNFSSPVQRENRLLTPVKQNSFVYQLNDMATYKLCDFPVRWQQQLTEPEYNPFQGE